jgi:D-threo-aldose 1-dehydrogenase
LGWKRTPLTTEEPTFEPGVWKNLKFDAEQKLGYDGILECYEQGNELLRGYKPNMVSVHDPDEYLERATNQEEDSKYYHDILEAYRALDQLKSDGKVGLIGVGAKNWKTIERISKDVNLDWVMIANSMTIKHHPPELIAFLKELDQRGVHIINSAVFHSGFLTGGEYFDYKLIDLQSPENRALIDWRKDFFELCLKYNIKPAHACVQFGLAVPGVRSIALNTTNPERVKENVEMVEQPIDLQFWEELKDRGLININFNEFKTKGSIPNPYRSF